MNDTDQGPVQQDLMECVLVLTLINPPVNALGHSLRAGISAGLDRAEGDPAIVGVVIRGQGRGFSAGADIREFGQAAKAPLLTDLCQRIEGFAKPVIAAMHGMALGGGLELALAARGRVGMAALRLGLPEVTLGVLPGAGGTQRLPRLIGAEAALRLMLSGRPVSAEDAFDLGLLDDVVPDEQALLTAALGLAKAPIDQQITVLQDPARFSAAVAEARRTVGKYAAGPAGARIIDCVEAALLLPPDQGFIFERTAFDDLRVSPEAAALRHAFFVDRQAEKPPAGYNAAAAISVTHLGIWGAGAAAVGLTGAALRAGLRVTLCDPSRDALVSALEAVGLSQETAVSEGRLSIEARDADWARLTPAVDPMAFAGAEAVILTDAERPLAVDFARGLATQIAVLVAGGVPDGAVSDVLGVWFAQRGVVEVAVGDGVTAATVATALGVLLRLGMRPIATALRSRGPGVGAQVVAAGLRAVQVLAQVGVPNAQLARSVAHFLRVPQGLVDGQGPLMAIRDEAIADRVLAAMVNAGAQLVSEGAARSPAVIDALMIGGYGFARFMGGPMHQADIRGLMVVRRNLRIWAEQDAVWSPDALFDSLIAEGRNFSALNGS
jgi:3-hydroxyacyl-CoA dehydrogenase